MSSNRVLSRLLRADFRLLEPHLEAVDLPLRKQLAARNRRVQQVYFPESGFASVVSDAGRPIELGIIGREGMTGLSIVMGNNDPASHETFMQLAGKGQRIAADKLRGAIEASRSLHYVMLNAAHAFMVQTTQTALANGRSKIEERLARWLLMADDRVDGNELQLTNEFLGIMLGVQRPGVTVALQSLEQTGLIRRKRGSITILDRDALQESANGTYVPPNDK